MTTNWKTHCIFNNSLLVKSMTLKVYIKIVLFPILPTNTYSFILIIGMLSIIEDKYWERWALLLFTSRLILRCRQEARSRFARLRSDVLVKLELLDNKKTQDVAYQLRRFIQGLAVYHKWVFIIIFKHNLVRSRYKPILYSYSCHFLT